MVASPGLAGCATSCPTALLPGVLVADGSAFAIKQDGSDVVQEIDWPFGYGSRSEGGRLLLTDLLGSVIAGEGDHVRLPGGETRSGGPWGVCGQILVDPQ